MTLDSNTADGSNGRPIRTLSHRTQVLVLALLGLGAWCGISTAPASAAVKHEHVSTFNGADAPGGPYQFVIGLAADTSGGANAGDLYVGSLNFSTFETPVDRFDAAGAYDGLHLTSTPSGPFSMIDFGTFALGQIAIDSSSGNEGALYVPDMQSGVVHRFESAGNYDCEITGQPSPSADECNGAAGSATPDGSFTPGGGVAVDSAGNVYVGDTANLVINVFGPDGDYLRQIDDPSITQLGALAVDSSGNVYLANRGPLVGENVVKFDSTGSFVSVLSTNAPTTVAVDPATDHVYVGEGTPEGQLAHYDPAGNLLATFGATQFAGGGSPVGVTVGSTGNVYALTSAGVAIFSAPVVVPDLSAEPASDVTDTSATLNGHVDPDTAGGGGSVTSCQFEYGTTTSYGQSAPCAPATPYGGPTDVSADIAGLAPSTTYHYRVVAANADGSNQSADATFTTGGPPSIEDTTAIGGTTRATLSAKVNAFGLDTTCEAEWVSEADFTGSGYANATTVPCSPSDLSAFGNKKVSAKVTGLEVDSRYHYRFVATNSAGTTTGPDRTVVTWGADSFDFTVTDEGGNPYMQAGGHPHKLNSEFFLNTNPTLDPSTISTTGTLKDAIVQLPPGLIGNPTATPRCSEYDLSVFQCPGSAQVGTITIDFLGGPGSGYEDVPLFNVEPPPGVPAQFAAAISLSANAFITAHPRTGSDYGIDAAGLRITGLAELTKVSIEMWGVPADPSHDAERSCPVPGGNSYQKPCSTTADQKPFLTMPTSCTGPLSVGYKLSNYQDPNIYATGSDTLPATTGCEDLPFTPSIEVQPDRKAADSPTGLSVDLKVPQNDNPDGVAHADLKDAEVVLPPGMTVSPSAADGLTSCSPAQIGMDNADQPTCPDAAKLGSVEVETPLLPVPLKGAIYQAEQENNPFNSVLAIYVVAEAQGVLIKLAGNISADPDTGQLTTTFSNNPQLPFTEFKLDFFGGPRAALVTPPTCGIYEAEAELSPWSAADPDNPTADEMVTSTSEFTVDTAPGGGPCIAGDPSQPGDPADRADLPSAPNLGLGTVTPIAGQHSPLVMRVQRKDGEQEITRIDADLPAGLTGKLAGIPQCSDAALNAIDSTTGTGAGELTSPSCPAGSQVGYANVGSGVGSSLSYVPGKVYLAGPYKGAPLSIAVVTPVVTGPFDLGSVVIRSALHIDQDDAQIHVKSDSIPTILEGIPLKIRDIRVVMDRPGFTLNPTNCSPMTVTGEINGAGETLNDPSDDTTVAVSDPFQVSGCGNLGFSPKLAGKILNGNDGIHRSDHPSLEFNLHGTLGDANLARVEVLLPSAFQIDQSNLGNICSEANLAANRCAGKNTIGSATATTPLLDTPLQGPVYAVSGSGGLPRLAVILRGPASMPIELIVRGDTTTEGARIRNTFATVPDAPVTDFDLNISGGDAGYLVNNQNICTKKAKKKAKKNRKRIKIYADAAFTGQNADTLRQRVQIDGCPKAKKKGKKSGKRKR